jgi:hypothetical protein
MIRIIPIAFICMIVILEKYYKNTLNKGGRNSHPGVETPPKPSTQNSSTGESARLCSFACLSNGFLIVVSCALALKLTNTEG